MHVPQTEVILRHDGAELAHVTLPPGEYVIGRSPDVEIFADTALLSRRHALLTINYDHLLLEDLGSSNGTFLNDQAVTEPTRVFPNQAIRLGPDLTLEVRRQRTPSEPGVSLAPAQAAIRRFLPEEILAEKRYAIGSEIARGGMGAILDARQNATQRTVAMKVMLGAGEEVDVVRFIEEAQVTAQLDHPNIVPIYELGVDEQDQLFYTMKLVRGITLKKVLELMARGVEATLKKYPLPVLLTVFQKVCDALAFAHSKGVIHRDLKPENIMLGDFGSVLVMDWGLAKVLGKKDAPTAGLMRSLVMSARATVVDSGSTMSGTIIGTPQYMAPEQARGEVETLDARADIYALGAILFHLLHLRPTVTGTDALDVVEKVKQGALDWTPPKKPLPESLVAICHKALALDRAQRYASVADLQADLLAYQTGFATSAEHASAWKQFALFMRRNKTASIGIAAVLLVGAILGTQAFVEGRRAQQALTELRSTAPTFFDQAKLLTDQGKLREALEKIGIALKLNPNDPSFYAQRGNILQSMERFAEAAGEYAQAARWNPQEPHAAENAMLSRRLAAAKEKDGEISVNVRTQWRDALVQQGRPEEAILAGRSLGTGVQKMLPAWQAKIDAWLGKNAPRVGSATGGFTLNLSSLSLTDLSPLRGMPLISVNVDKNPHLKDLSPLADCPLENFSAEGASELTDLSPLQGKKIKSVDLRSTNVSDLRPLAGMPLESVSLNGAAVSDLTPLRETKLKILDLQNTKVRDLSPLAGMPLEHLGVKGAPIASVAPVGDAPLAYLEISTPFDLAALRAHQLRTLRVLDSMFDHPAELAKLTDLEVLILPAAFSDPAPLRNLRHLRKIDFPESFSLPVEKLKNAADFFHHYDALSVRAARKALVSCGLKGVPVRNVSLDPTGRLCVDLRQMTVGDLTPLHDLPIKELLLSATGIQNLEALRGMPLETLYLDTTNVSDLEPLRGSPLQRIRLHSSHMQDVSPLADCPELEWIELPQNAKNVETLRALKKLRYLSPNWDSALHPAQTAEEFWKEYDAKQAAAKK
jgi:Leucine-rich repeat (LRR) protein/tetratricopeptide (TPR) repeat protein/tRNA A-37 threonylcarbamoyl transferase component Bud32